jgi:hypothetical protein
MVIDDKSFPRTILMEQRKQAIQANRIGRSQEQHGYHNITSLVAQIHSQQRA